MRPFLSITTSLSLLMSLAVGPVAAAPPPPTTPIQHVVVIFGENISFDHYFGTYPVAQNPPGQPRFIAKPGTPAVNGLTPTLLIGESEFYQRGQWSRRRQSLPPQSESGVDVFAEPQLHTRREFVRPRRHGSVPEEHR